MRDTEGLAYYAYTAFALYFAPAFFPHSDPVVQQLNAAVLFAATFLMRPLGGWLFGYIADRYGRRISLTLSVVCMCLGSLLIAVTPTHQTIGIAAPAILALARMLRAVEKKAGPQGEILLAKMEKSNTGSPAWGDDRDLRLRRESCG